jgi:Ca2+-binding RTX toxin-like protein
MATFYNTSIADKIIGTVLSDVFTIADGAHGQGDDRFFGGFGRDTAMGGIGQDMLYGGDESDQLFGGDGHDSLYGGPGDDALFGGPGNDALFGGFGSMDSVTFERAITLTLSPGTSIAIGDGFQTLLTGIEVFFLSASDDSFTGNATANLIYGGDGADTLRGLGGADALYTGDGRDVLYGGGGVDYISAFAFTGDKTIYGGADTDIISLGDGDDLCHGGQGDDQLNLNDGNDTSADTLFGDDGDDTLATGGGNDRLYGGVGHDTLQLQPTGPVTVDLRLASQTIAIGASTLTIAGFEDVTVTSSGARIIGTIGENVIRTFQGNDVITALGGNDTVEAGSGQDRIYGGDGDDMLIHNVVTGDQRAADTFSGGAGRDTFVFGHLDASSNAQNSTDRITDFEPGQDQIDLRGQIRFVDDTARAIAYRFIDRAAFSGQQDELRFEGGLLLGDTDGDAKPDFAIKLTGVTTLTITDLLL